MSGKEKDCEAGSDKVDHIKRDLMFTPRICYFFKNLVLTITEVPLFV